LTCDEDQGIKTGLLWAEFPKDLNSFRNPVVARSAEGVDTIYISGNSGSKATLWSVQNYPVTNKNGEVLAHFGGVWTYPLADHTFVGQPILGPADKDPEETKLYFVEGTSGDNGTSKLTAVLAQKGTMKFETPAEANKKWSGEQDPVMDKDGNVMFWSENTLYGFRPNTSSLFTAGVASSALELRFGPGGTLYTAYTRSVDDKVATVGALIPSFQQAEAGPEDIYSPTRLYVTGAAGRRAAANKQNWALGARGSVMLGEGFSVEMGETLTVRVNASQ
jgi:hypothetical protein